MQGFSINCCCGTGVKPCVLLSISPYLHFQLDEMPNDEIRKNQKETFGFEWSLLDDKSQNTQEGVI